VLVEAAGEEIHAPDLYDDPAEVARFWVEFNCGLWQRTLRIEKREGLAICDSDPLHLYFSWSLWRAEALGRDLFDAELPLYRRAIEKKQIGFADVVLWQEAPVKELQRRAKLDTAHRRRRHKLYLRLIPWMRAWFDARGHVLPGTVQACPSPARLQDIRDPSVCATARSHRYDAAAIDAMLAGLSSEPG
jgi:hypothetical protein